MLADWEAHMESFNQEIIGSREMNNTLGKATKHEAIRINDEEVMEKVADATKKLWEKQLDRGSSAVACLLVSF